MPSIFFISIVITSDGNAKFDCANFGHTVSDRELRLVHRFAEKMARDHPVMRQNSNWINY